MRSGRKAERKRRRGDGRSAVFFLSPSMIIFSVFILFPVVFSFFLSFQKWNMFSQTMHYVGLANYQRAFTSADFWSVMKNTFLYTLGTVPLNMAISLGAAMLLSRKLVGKKFLRTAFFAPVVVSPVAAAVIWRWIYEPNFGILNYVLHFFGVPPINWLNDPTSAMVALIVMGVWKTMGINMVLFSAGLDGIPDQYYEAAQIDGAGPWRKFWKITVPLLAPTTFFILVMSMIGSFQVFDLVYVLTSGGPLGATKVLVFYIYEQAFKFFDMGYASAIAYVLFAVIFILTLIQIRFMKKRVYFAT